MRLWHLHEAVSHNIEKRLSAWARFRPASKYHSWWVEIVLERSAPEEVPGNWRMVTIFVIECGPTADIADELPSDEEWGEDRSWYASRDKDLAFLRIGRPEQTSQVPPSNPKKMTNPKERPTRQLIPRPRNRLLN